MELEKTENEKIYICSKCQNLINKKSILPEYFKINSRKYHESHKNDFDYIAKKRLNAKKYYERKKKEKEDKEDKEDKEEQK